jgi:hypothetical protein
MNRSKQTGMSKKTIIVLLHQHEVTGVALPREIAFPDHDHSDAHQGPPARRLSTVTATGTAIGGLQSSSVLWVGSQAFTFHR